MSARSWADLAVWRSVANYLAVRPGLTGLWQVRARQDPSFDRYVALDITYVENWSFWLDLKILVRTVGVVFAGTGS